MSDSGSDFENVKPKAKKVTAGLKAKSTTIKPMIKKSNASKKSPLAYDQSENAVHMDEEDDYFEEESVAKAAPAKKKRVSGVYDERKAIEEIYQKKTQLEHILLRPDTYIGSVEAQQQPMWVHENGQFVYRTISFVPGLYKIVDEILVNAADNKIRDPRMDSIKVNIDTEAGRISVENNGRGIPIEMHKVEKVYVPELIFGHLLTGSNFNDNERKITGGRNGYGAKLCNIFSKRFVLETADGDKKYKQVFTDNMSKIGTPAISANPRGEEYTRITFEPDFEKFGMTGIDADLEALLRKRVYDMAGVVKNIKVLLNGERLKIRGFKQYVDQFVEAKSNDDESTSKQTAIFESGTDRWEVGFALSDGQFQQVSFVNSICTSKGGTHVALVADQIANKLLEAVKKKNKSASNVKAHQIKSHLWVFVNCLIENPAFDSQTKDYMTLKASAFGSKWELSDDFFKKILKSGVLENILNWTKFKQDQQLKKTDGAKRSRLTGIVKLEDANNAGTRLARQCTLILTEGDSAKALAVSGLSVVGRDNYGVFPLRGKLLNVRDATHQQIMANSEISQIKQILGLQHGKKYESTDTLRYGHLMIMTDQDHDGSHIKGLLINFLDHFYPSLLRIPGFLLEFITPIVKVTKGKRSIPFYTIPEYEAWKEVNDEGRGWTIKYYKGLGTSTKEDAVRYFSALERHEKRFAALTDQERELVDMAFNKKRADDRKEWLRQYVPGTHIDHEVEEISIEDFVQKELILFSIADNARSIPSMVDGLKPGQRKVLFGCFKRKLRGEIKVAQLGGYVAEHSAYHHGEQSLTMTIVGLAQDFVGSNNVNLLEPRGQFGTRLQGGKDAASARYIFTALNPITRQIFQSSDDRLLSYLNEDGDRIEPQWYMPVIPMVLVNGSDGIGTGWSSSIPNYNPDDIVANIRRLMNGEELVPMMPWYRGFKGSIERIGEDKFKISGMYNVIDDNTIEIIELPIRSWTQTYKEQLESWVTGGEKVQPWVKDYKEYHTDSSVHFVISLTDDNMRKAVEEGIEKRFKLATTLTTTNMVCFDSEGRIKKYSSPEEILLEFYHLRLDYYHRRKELLLKQYEREWSKADNRVRFVREIITGSLVVQNKKRADVIAELKRRNYAPMRKQDEEETDDEVRREEEAEGAVDVTEHGFDYLLSMPIWNLTWEKVKKLEEEMAEKHQQLRVLSAKSAKDLWNEDLDAFQAQWEVDTEVYAQQNQKRPAVKKGKGRARAKGSDDDEDDFKPQVKRASLPKKQAKVTTLDKFVTAKPKTGVAAEAKSKMDNQATKASAYIELSDGEKSASAKPMSMADKIKAMAASKSKGTPTGADDPYALPESNNMKAAAPKLAVKKKPVVVSDDSDFEMVEAVAKKPAPKKRALAVDSDEDDAFEVSKPAPKKKIVVKPKAKDLTQSEDVNAAVQQVKKPSIARKPVAPKAVPAKKPVARKANVISDEDTDMESVAPKKAAPRAARTTKKASKYVVSSGSEDEPSEDESEFDMSD